MGAKAKPEVVDPEAGRDKVVVKEPATTFDERTQVARLDEAEE